MSDPFHNKKREQLTSRRNFLKEAGSVALVTPILGSKAEASYKPLDGEKKLRMGIVGGGFGSAFPWHEHPNCEVTAVSDLREDRRKKLMEKFKCSNAYAEFHPMLMVCFPAFITSTQ